MTTSRSLFAGALAAVLGGAWTQMCPSGNAPVATGMQFLFPVNATGGIPGYGLGRAPGNGTASWGLGLVGKSCWSSRTVASAPASGGYSGTVDLNGPESGTWTSTSGDSGTYSGTVDSGISSGTWTSTSGDHGSYSGTVTGTGPWVQSGTWTSTSGDHGSYSGTVTGGGLESGTWTSSTPGANNTVFSYLFASTLSLDTGMIYDYANRYGQAAAGVMPAIYDTTQPGGALQYNTTYALPYNPDIWYDDEGREGFLMQSGGTNITFWSNHSVQVDVWNPVVGSPSLFKNGSLSMQERVRLMRASVQ